MYGGESVAESARPKKAQKVLSHMEVKPRLGGGVHVIHHYTDYHHDPKPYEFAEGEGAKFHAHMAKHTGMKHEEIEEQEGSEPEPHD